MEFANIDVQWNGPGNNLTINGSVPRPFISYKDVNIRIGTTNCRVMARNTLVIRATLPNQRASVWERQAGADGEGDAPKY